MVKKRAKVSLKQMKEFLYKYEAGMPKADIAKDASRDVRTIDKYLAQARKEADLRAARREILTGVLTKHNDALLGVVNNVIEALQVPSAHLEMRQDDVRKWLEIQLPKAKAYHESERFKVFLQDEYPKSKRWTLLFEHLGSESLLPKLFDWKKTMASHLDLRKALKLQLLEEVRSKTGLSVEKETNGTPTNPILYWALADVLFPVYVNRAFGVPDGTDPEHKLKIDNLGYLSLLGTGTHLGWLSPKGGDLRDKTIEALKDLVQSREFKQLKPSYPIVQRTTDELRDEFEEIVLLGFVAGRCSVCERLER